MAEYKGRLCDVNSWDRGLAGGVSGALAHFWQGELACGKRASCESKATMLARSRVFLWCLVAGCAGGPITDFPDNATGNESGGSEPPGVPSKSDTAGDSDGDDSAPTGVDGPGDHAGDEFGDGDLPDASDAGIDAGPSDRPCGVTLPDASDAGAADAGSCSGDACPITRSELGQLAVREAPAQAG